MASAEALELASAVIEWWNAHKYDTVDDGGEERNVYFGVPEFVNKAGFLLGLTQEELE